MPNHITQDGYDWKFGQPLYTITLDAIGTRYVESVRALEDAYWDSGNWYVHVAMLRHSGRQQFRLNELYAKESNVIRRVLFSYEDDRRRITEKVASLNRQLLQAEERERLANG